MKISLNCVYFILNLFTFKKKFFFYAGPPKEDNFFDPIYDINRWLSRSRQLGDLVPVFSLGVPLRRKASKLEYSCIVILFFSSHFHLN